MSKNTGDVKDLLIATEKYIGCVRIHIVVSHLRAAAATPVCTLCYSFATLVMGLVTR